MEGPENKPEVNHKDGDKTNNHRNNLEWATEEENYDHAVQMEFYVKKLKRKDIASICQKLQVGRTGVQIAKEYEVTSGAIYKIKKTYFRGWLLYLEFG